LAPRLFAGSIRKSNRGGLCITRQSTPTPKGVRSLRSRLFLGAGYFYVRPMSASSTIVKIGVAAVALPAIGFALGLALQAIIPGCKCDEGAGCSPCAGFGGLIGFLVFGGFVGALFSLLFLLPASLLLAAIAGIFGDKKPARRVAPLDDDRVKVEGLATVLADYKAGRPTTIRCQECRGNVLVKPVISTPGSSPTTLEVSCACGSWNGTYETN
jgi:DNA-directed RNA polymerase subunit RPC12/RpoP